MLTLAGVSFSEPPLAIKGTAVIPPVPPEVAVDVPVPVRLNQVSSVNCVAPNVDVAGPKVT